jgi:peroxiredoxin
MRRPARATHDATVKQIEAGLRLTAKGRAMSVLLSEIAPDFEAETTEGQMRFHDWIGDSWAVLFSHPKDFTPVCTTELGYMAKIKPEFDRRNVKVIGLSVDTAEDHRAWAKDIQETQGHAPNYPIISDADFHVSKRYGMLPAATSGRPYRHDPGGASLPGRRCCREHACTASKPRRMTPTATL